MSKSRAGRQIPFAKYHGLGNDFIVVADARLEPDQEKTGQLRGLSSASNGALARLARSICDRHTGVGADGLLLLLPPKQKRHSARMRVFNADGSEAEMSGNGIRCAAAYLASGRRYTHGLHFETPAGVKNVVLRRVVPGGSRNRYGTGFVYQVEMGQPILDPPKIPFGSGAHQGPVVDFPLATLGGVVTVTVTSMGNPHCSVFVDNFETVGWMELGREIERHELFPHSTNVEFVRVVSRREIEVRFWERGVGVTQSSGTGSCAAVVASVLTGLTERKVCVRTVAGFLEVDWPANGGVRLTGPAEWIAEGTYGYRPD